jgi:hypothetical protein
MFDYYKVSKLQKKIFTLLYLALCKIHVRMVFLLYFEASTATVTPQNPKSALCHPPYPTHELFLPHFASFGLVFADKHSPNKKW